jgi:site-specific DNA-cytosine methylase
MKYTKRRPIVFDFFCGLGGFSQPFIDEGYRAIGFDIEAHDYGNGGYPGELVLADVRKINGAELVKQYGVPACIVASPPCQRYSYFARRVSPHNR